jgi:hypothetical protein
VAQTVLRGRKLGLTFSPASIYSGVDHRGTVGKVAPGLFAQEGRCWRMVYENPVGHGTFCMEPVAWVGRWKFLKGWTKVWSASVTRTSCRGRGVSGQPQP